MALFIIPVTAVAIYKSWISDDIQQDDIHSWAQQEIAARRQVVGDENIVSVKLPKH